MSGKKDIRLLVCVNPVGSNKPCCGGDRGSEALASALEEQIAEHRVDARVERIHCLNRCLRGPAMRIAPGGAFFLDVDAATIPDIIDALRDVAGLRSDSDDEDDDPFSGLDGAFPGG